MSGGTFRARPNAVLLAVVLLSATVVTSASLAVAARAEPDGAFVAQYDRTEDAATRVLIYGDGQFFGMLAEDPTLDRPDALDVGDVDGQFAYRAMRPAYGWAAWLTSLGQPLLVPWSLMGLTVLSVALLFLGVERLAVSVGRDPRVAAAVIGIPGVIRLLCGTGPEIAASACACFAVAAAVGGRPQRASAWLIGAVLLRETLLLVVIGLLLGRYLRLRHALLPAAVLAAWIGVVWLRIGALPAGGGRLEFLGLLDAAGSWNRETWIAALALVPLTVLAAIRSRLGLAVAIPHVVLALAMAPATWVIEGFGRILLPMYAIALPFVSPRMKPPQTAEPPGAHTEAAPHSGAEQDLDVIVDIRDSNVVDLRERAETVAE